MANGKQTCYQTRLQASLEDVCSDLDILPSACVVSRRNELKPETFVGGEMNQSAGCGWSDYWMQRYTFEALSLFCLSNFLGVFQ